MNTVLGSIQQQNTTENPNTFTLLVLYMVRQLEQQNIRTVSDFILCEAPKLRSITNLPNDQIAQLKVDLHAQFGPSVIDGLTMQNRRATDSFVLSTGLRRLDALLDGGLLTGTFVEICGAAVVGKSLVSDAIALHFVRHHRMPVYYISTKNACSPIRCYSLLQAGVGLLWHDKISATAQIDDDNDDVNYNSDANEKCSDIAAEMSLLRCERVRTLPDLVSILRRLLKPSSSASLGVQRDWQLLCVDSLTAILMPFIGQTSHKAGLSLMNETLALLRRLAVEQQKIVVAESLVLHDYPNEMNEQISLSTIARYWPSYASVRLYVRKSRAHNASEDDDDDADLLHAIEVTLLKSNQHRSGPDISCVLKIGNGID